MFPLNGTLLSLIDIIITICGTKWLASQEQLTATRIHVPPMGSMNGDDPVSGRQIVQPYGASSLSTILVDHTVEMISTKSSEHSISRRHSG